MLREFWNSVDCINCQDQSLIEASLIEILKKEGFTCLSSLPENISINEIQTHSREIRRRLIRELWLIGLFPGASNWTVIKTAPQEFMCRRDSRNNNSKPRLSELAVKIGCKAFHWSVYHDNYGILLETNENGNTVVSGYHPITRESEKYLFYQEPINYSEAWKFHLIDIPEAIKEAIRPDTKKEWQEKEARLNELEKLFEQGVNTQLEEAELLTGCGTKADRILRQFIGNSSRYWTKGVTYYSAYTEAEQIQADGGKLLYFKPPEYYQQLDYKNIAPKY
jgi:hypothetical protein